LLYAKIVPSKMFAWKIHYQKLALYILYDLLSSRNVIPHCSDSQHLLVSMYIISKLEK
jgi:hypothetical protein